MKNVAVALVTLIASSVAQAQQAVQWRVEDGGNGHWYAFKAKSTVICWHDARALCELQGGHLASITSSAENQLLLALTIPNNPGGIEGGPYIGGTCEGLPWGQWYWITGEPFSYTAWMPGAPNGSSGATEPYLHFWRWSNLGWNDQVDCGGLMFSYLIEWDADCNSDGIVDYGQCRDGSLPDYNGNNVPDCCESGTPCEVGNYPVQWRVEDGGNGHWYGAFGVTGGTRWVDCSNASQARGGYLATITSLAENIFVTNYAVAHPEAWNSGDINGFGPVLGGWQPEPTSAPNQGWRWVSNELWDFTSWKFGEPNDHGQCGPGGYESYLALIGGTGWNDVQDTTLCVWGTLVPGYLVEWSADCNGDGIVDKGQILQGQLVDADANGVPDVCEVDPCPGDITNGGTVDATDLSIVLAAWGTNGQGEFQADIDGSGLVDGGDLALVLGGWGPCPQ